MSRFLAAGTTRRLAGLVLALCLLAPPAVATPPVPAAPTTAAAATAAKKAVRAGAAKIDATWRVGASAGQYAGKSPGMIDTHGQTVEPHGLSATQHPSHGIHSRDWVRALVLEGANGDRMAVVTNDLYIPQDLINRRVGQIIAAHDRAIEQGTAKGTPTGITQENLTISISHNHTSPYYSSTAWGAMAFQDVFDIRFFEHYANAMAQAVIQASSDLRPARVGGAAMRYQMGKRHSYGPGVGNDGLPAGYPMTDSYPDLTVLAVDDLSNPAAPRPLATWTVYGMHPEHLKTPQLLTTEYVGALHRFVERETGGVSLFSQNDTGTSEPAREALAHTPEQRQEFSGRHFAQMERQGRQLADAVQATRADITAVTAGGSPRAAHTVVPFSAKAPVAVKDLRFAPPGTRLSPTVSSCRTDKVFDGNPGVPVVGLPNCRFAHGEQGSSPVVEELRKNGIDPTVTYDTLREAGIPVPDNIGFPSYIALQETVQVHLQAIRIGDIGITVCPCEQFSDQSRNIVSRLDRKAGNQWYGFDWTANPSHPDWRPGVRYDGARDESGRFLPGHGPAALGWCTQNEDTTWTCRNPKHKPRFWGAPDPNEPEFLAPVSDEAFRRMKAQIYNDAAGWDDMANALAAESEPVDPAKIWGNYTQDEYHDEMDGGGYRLVVPVSMSNDYLGYIPSYREFQQTDHYRKALAGLGPHSSDFLATRLARMAAELKGGPEVVRSEKDVAYDTDSEHQKTRVAAIGAIARTYLPAYEAQLPADGGTPAITTQPADVRRFAAGHVAWTGGSNYTDSPEAVVERCIKPGCAADDPSAWERYADGAGDVQVRVHYPKPQELPAYRAGQHAWRWEATWETQVSDVALPDAQGRRRFATPAGTYRFVVSGCHRGLTPGAGEAGACSSWDATNRVARYRLVSEPFDVAAWDGITITDLQARAAGTDGYDVSFGVAPQFTQPIGASNTEAGPLDYPDTYASPFPYINAAREVREYGVARPEAFCLKCSFRPWADTGRVASATVTWTGADGSTGTATATALGDRWVARVPATARAVFVAPRQLRDPYGNYNGTGTPPVALD